MFIHLCPDMPCKISAIKNIQYVCALLKCYLGALIICAGELILLTCELI